MLNLEANRQDGVVQSPFTATGAHISRRTMDGVESFNRQTYRVPLYWLDTEGEMLCPDPSDTPLTLPPLRQAVRDALQQAYRWGEPFIFFLCPGLIAWVVPLCNGDVWAGGILSGGVLVDESDRADVAVHLCGCGLAEDAARSFAEACPVWPGGLPRTASAELSRNFYTRSGWTPSELLRHQENAAQQRQIAEAIHTRKEASTRLYPLDEERRLLAMIRIGDRAGARGVLNQLLAALFLRTPGLPLLRARAVELMGYLARAAIDDNPQLEPLMERSQRWIETLVEARTFDELCVALGHALDDFIESVITGTAQPGNPAVQRALDFVGEHYTEQINLADVAAASGLSSYRIAHLVKEATGRTVMQHVRILRLAAAGELLENTRLTGAEIAARLGFHDQSHFIREFRAMSGTTPLQYRQGRRSTPVAEAVGRP